MEGIETGVTFRMSDGKEYHSFYDFGLRQLAKVTMTPPSAKRHIISDVPGVDGDIDITEDFGPMRFENRTIETVFEGQDLSFDQWAECCSEIVNALHERSCDMVLDIDPEYHWTGTVRCTPTKEAIALSEMTITMNAFPYKIRETDNHMEITVNGNADIEIECGRMPTVPVFTTSSGFSIEYNGMVQTIGEGETEAEFEIVEGTNSLTLTGTGTVSIDWKDGRL